MFWACEKKPTEFWNDDLLIHTVRELISELIQWLKLKCCINYFIPRNNMMDHLIGKDLSLDINLLQETIGLQSEGLITDVNDCCTESDLLFANVSYNIRLPNWIKRACLIYHRLNNDEDNFTELFSTNFTADLQNALHQELSNIFTGLSFQCKAEKATSASAKLENSLKAEYHFKLSLSLWESADTDTIEDCPWMVTKSLLDDFLACEDDESDLEPDDDFELDTHHGIVSSSDDGLSSFSCKSTNDKVTQKSLLYSRFDKIVYEKETLNVCNEEKGIKDNGINIEVHMVCKDDVLDSDIGTEILYFKDWPGRSPTVNISWFLAKAHLANLYYRTKRDVSLTMMTCDDIVSVHMQSLSNQLFAEQTFPVVLSTQWSAVYDKEIQAMLGFYSLCTYVIDVTAAVSPLVYLGVCPVQFALYIKVRSELEQRFSDSVTTWKHVYDYNEHARKCGCDTAVNNGEQVVRTTLFTMLSGYFGAQEVKEHLRQIAQQ